jgi:eukaryotic-like serine/threonine-protein kinase
MSGTLEVLPRVLGRYALFEAIAAGGMATVHFGRLLGPVGFARTVAIKRLHPHYAADPQILATLLDEARLVARIRHPNVVPTLDVVAEQGELLLVMDYVQGESLSALIRQCLGRGTLVPPDMAATMLAGVLHGLHAAHEALDEHGQSLGIVHRDVSPQNVLVGVDGVARVVDFGVAKAAVRVGESTNDGHLKGKLGYMAPEQTTGEVGRRTDIYSASVVLWETLTGRRLFTGDNNMEVFAKVMAGCQEPPSRYALGVPKALDVVTMRGLSLDPQARFETAREMARALEDAMPMVTASKIGEWVETVASEVLDARAKRVAAVESSSPMIVPSRAELKSNPKLQGPVPIPTPVTPYGAPTQLSSPTVLTRGMAPPAKRDPRAATVAFAVGVIGALILFFALRAGLGSSSSSSAAAPEPTGRAADQATPPAPALTGVEGAAVSPDASDHSGDTPAPPGATGLTDAGRNDLDMPRPALNAPSHGRVPVKRRPSKGTDVYDHM